MALSHAQLRRWYVAYNKRWFGGKLPDDMDLFYAPDDKAHGLAICHENGERMIKIDTAIAGSRWAKMTLLHECNHHYTGDFTHGVRFQAGMARLATLGAFRGIW
ncbi:MAG TPA: hypothetical protein VFB43_18060 [Terracidiphilus sp.]|nr:hypothetical protein [Terracidiphilus sp.]